MSFDAQGLGYQSFFRCSLSPSVRRVETEGRMDPGPFIAIGVFTLMTFVGHYLLPSRAKRIQRKLAAQPRTRIKQAEGAVRVSGRVRRIGELLHAPLSGRACVAYELIVESTGSSVGSDGFRHRWVDRRQACPFVVADESGEARIDPSGPFLLALVIDRTGTTGWLDPYPGKHRELGAYLQSLGFRPTNWMGRWAGSLYYAEGVLEEGEMVSVSGDSAREIDPMGERTGPRSPPERLVLRGTEAQPLLISDARAAGA
jgi:hypothetical protein